MRRKGFALTDKQELRSRLQLKYKDEQLLQMLFSTYVSPDEKIAFSKDLDIEKEPMEFNLMLAHLCHRHGVQRLASGSVIALMVAPLSNNRGMPAH